MFNILHLFDKRNLYLNCKLLKSGGNAINSAQRKMRPNKTGQIAKCNIPLPNENPSQLYIISEIKNEDERPGAEVKALNTGTSLLPTKNVFLDNLEVVEVDTSDVVGYDVSINKVDYSQVTVKVVNVSEQKIMLNFGSGIKGVETNVWLTIEDENGKKHVGTFFKNC